MNHKQLVDYCIEMKSGENSRMKWCKQFPTKKLVYLFEPCFGEIRVNTMQSFKVHAEAKKFALIVDTNFTYFNKLDENMWHLETKVTT